MATLGGLLFGYDTAVISGTVESLRKFFIEPFGLPLDQANALEGFVVSSALIGCRLDQPAVWTETYACVGCHPVFAVGNRFGMAGTVCRDAW